jgi:predicted dinucleotide-binding enzyme
MRVGILGSGLMGGKLGTIFARAGHDVVFSYARREEKLKELAREAGVLSELGKIADEGVALRARGNCGHERHSMLYARRSSS